MRHPPVRATVREFVCRGWTPAEAGNVTAWLNGLTPVAGGWTPEAIEALAFMAWLVRSGRLTGDTPPRRLPSLRPVDVWHRLWS